MKRFSLLCLLLLVTFPAMAAASLDDCIAATCRITAPDGNGKANCGTGVCYSIVGSQVYVMTNAHVVGNADTVACEFWTDGHQSDKIPASVLGVRKNNCDLAVVVLRKEQFGGHLPKAIPLSNWRPLPEGSTITSVGCAGAAWSTAWKGHVLGYEGNNMLFLPPPAGGRSGSAIFDADGTQIVALIHSREGNDQYGIATVGATLGNYIQTSLKPAQCPGGVCPTPQAPQYRLLPYRQQQENRNPYPTLPPASPSVDLSGLESLLRANNDQIRQGFGDIRDILKDQRTPDIPVPEAKPVIPQEFLDKQAALEKAVEAMKEPSGGLVSRLKGRIQDAKEEGAEGVREIVHSVIKGQIDDYKWYILAAVAVLVYLVRKDILDKIRNGDPLFVEKVADRLGLGGKLALGQQVVHRVVERVRDGVDDLRNQSEAAK